MQDKLTAIADNSVALYEKCVNNHYIATVTGDGTGTMTFQVPFAVDTLAVLCLDPLAQSSGYNIIQYHVDLMAMSLAGAVAVSSRNGSLSPVAVNAEIMITRCSQADDGTVTLLTGISSCVFGKDMPYLVMATKYTDKTLKERYTELVESLTGSGTLIVCSDRIYSVFTTAEWTALTATKPDWTFKEI